MKHIRPYRLVILIVLPIAILVLIRAMGPDHFKHDTRKLAEASFHQANLINSNQLSRLSGKLLTIYLGDQINQPNDIPGLKLRIPFSKLLEKTSLKTIKTHNGPVLLYSSDPGVSAKAWMILTQMGFRNLYIFTGDTNNEVMKYKFRPETTQAGISQHEL
jgi:hypothetical protein